MEKSKWIKINFVIPMTNLSPIYAFLEKETEKMFFVTKRMVYTETEQDGQLGYIAKIKEKYEFFNKDWVLSVEYLLETPKEGFISEGEIEFLGEDIHD